MRPATLRRLVGAPTFATELELHRLDCAASHGNMTNHAFLVAFQAARRTEPVLPKPWVTGHDILPLGVPAGREIGRWKQRVYDAQLEVWWKTGRRRWLGSDVSWPRQDGSIFTAFFLL